MLLKVIALTFFTLLFSYSVQAATTYDFLTRSAGVNAFAYEGISSSALPLNNTFPSNQHSNSEYTSITAKNPSELNFETKSHAETSTDEWVKIYSLPAVIKMRMHYE